MEAVKTNILGTENVLEATIQNRVKRIVCLSTDKSVYPINAMGISKAMMEKVIVTKSRNLEGTDTVICGTRYGNVMTSRGSVIPLFVEQVREGKALSITDPTMTRFMMTLADAVDLVLHAFEYGENGDIFVQKAAAATIDMLANGLMGISVEHFSVGLYMFRGLALHTRKPRPDEYDDTKQSSSITCCLVSRNSSTTNRVQVHYQSSLRVTLP